jgi:hypothetical protein
MSQSKREKEPKLVVGIQVRTKIGRTLSSGSLTPTWKRVRKGTKGTVVEQRPFARGAIGYLIAFKVGNWRGRGWYTANQLTSV